MNNIIIERSNMHAFVFRWCAYARDFNCSGFTEETFLGLYYYFPLFFHFSNLHNGLSTFYTTLYCNTVFQLAFVRPKEDETKVVGYNFDDYLSPVLAQEKIDIIEGEHTD